MDQFNLVFLDNPQGIEKESPQKENKKDLAGKMVKHLLMHISSIS
jgi:hypothetical protein